MVAIFIQTLRLILRKFREEDFTDFCEYAMDEEMCRMVGWQNMNDIAAAKAVFDKMCAEPRGYAMVYKETGKVIGNFSVSSLHPFLKQLPELQGKRGCVISFALSKAYQRRGLVYEAASAVIDYLLRVEQMEFINAGYFSYNTPSKGLQEKLGFRFLATHGFRRGEEEIEVIENIIWNQQI